MGCLSITTLSLAVSVTSGSGWRKLHSRGSGESAQGPKLTQDTRGGGPANLDSYVVRSARFRSCAPGAVATVVLAWGVSTVCAWGRGGAGISEHGVQGSAHVRSGALAPTFQFSGVGQPPGFALTGRRGHPGSLPILLAGSGCLVWGAPRVEPILIQFLSVCLNGHS